MCEPRCELADQHKTTRVDQLLGPPFDHPLQVVRVFLQHLVGGVELLGVKLDVTIQGEFLIQRHQPAECGNGLQHRLWVRRVDACDVRQEELQEDVEAAQVPPRVEAELQVPFAHAPSLFLVSLAIVAGEHFP